MEIIIFIFYLVLFAVIISRIPFFANSGIGQQRLIALFCVKVAAGLAYAGFYRLPRYYAGSDTWRFYRLSLAETKWLLHDPAAFFKDLFIYGYSESGNLFTGKNTYWNDLKSNIPVKLMAITNVLTNNSYYANIIIFNFLFLFGLVALFKFFDLFYPYKKDLIIVGVFLLPSALFWCSGIHKEGLILSATGICIYCLQKEINHGFTLKRQIVLFLGFLLMFSLRNYVLLAMAPAIFAWWLSSKNPLKKSGIFGLVYLVCITAFFVVPLMFPSVSPLLYIAEKQHEFLRLQGSSIVTTNPLQPDVISFLSFLPTALDMAFLRPSLTEINNLSYIPAAAEVLLIILLVVISLLSVHKGVKTDPAIVFLFFFSLSVMLLCGYTIPFIGAIVRYRSFALPLLVTPLLCMTDFSYFSKRSLQT